MTNTEVILVDVGNSSIKSTAVSDGIFGETIRLSGFSELIKSYGDLPMIFSSVRKIPSEIVSRQNTVVLSSQTPLPIQLDYHTPETLGSDRIAAAVGAFGEFPNEDNLIVDMGTCITMDLMDKSGVFRGGSISPGLQMRMKSMSQFTEQLPDISQEWQLLNPNQMGKTTKECLLSGSYWGIIHEINGVFKAISKDFTSLNMILSGGDAHFFESNLKAHIFAGSKIVQKGLYRIWKYQQ